MISLTILFLFLFITPVMIEAQNWTWVKGNSTGDESGVYGTLETSDAGNLPGGRSGSVSWRDNSGNLWLFGGVGFDASSGINEYLNDLWRYNISSNEWAWMKGNSTIFMFADFGTQGFESSSNTPGGIQYAASAKGIPNEFWLFGGAGYDVSAANGNYNNYLNDLWKYDISSGNWTWVEGDGSNPARPSVFGSMGIPDANNKPGGREQSVMWADGSGNLWLFGGYGYDELSNTDVLNDLWKYNISSGEWTWVKGNSILQPGTYGDIGVSHPDNTPGGRRGACKWTDNSGNLWLFGGNGYDATTGYNPLTTYLNDLWKFNITTEEWVWMKGDDVKDQSGVYGSLGVADDANNPGGRTGAVSWTDEAGNLWLLGGNGIDESGNTGDLNDLWVYNVTSGNWTWVKGDNSAVPANNSEYGSQGVSNSANKPGGRQFAAGWTDISTNNLWLFGGYGYDVSDASSYYLSDLWKLAGGPLPVELQSFSANIINSSIELLWVTATEVNNYGFEVQKSVVISHESGARNQSENKEWNTIGFIKGNGNSNSVKEYSFTDSKITAGDYFYRLKQIDNDGSFEYSYVVEVSHITPIIFKLEQNYPNPFNPSTVISYNLPVNSFVILKIFDVLGNEVRSISEGNREAGFHKINFNSKGLSSGIYIYQLKAGNYSSSKTLMILK